MGGAVSSGRIRRSGRDAGVPARSPRHTSAPGRNSHSPSTSVPTPFLPVYAALLAVAPLVMGPGRLPLGQGLDFSGSPVPASPPVATVGPAVPYLFTPRCPFFCPQLDAFSISLNVPSPVVRRTRPLRPGLLLGLIRARARCSRVVPVLAVPCSPALPFSGRDGGATYLRGGGFLPSRTCLGASSPPTPLYGYTFTLFRRHPCRHGRHGRPSIRLQMIHVHCCERLVSFPKHDNSSSIQHLGDECRAEPRELQLRSPRSFQRYVVDPYQLSCLVLSPLDLAVVVMFLVQRCPLQPRTSVSVRRPQSPLECGHVLAHCADFLFHT